MYKVTVNIYIAIATRPPRRTAYSFLAQRISIKAAEGQRGRGEKE
ncbi:hypothetical protein [Argonema galeatum]|nr:hypothetical protein [Argonema galeatum]